MLLWEMRDVGHILSDVGFTLPTWLLVFAEEVATTISYFIMLIYYLTFFFHYKKKGFHFGSNKVCSTNQSNILQFFLWRQIQPHISLWWISSNQFQSNSDLFGSATQLKIYSNEPVSQKLINISEKHEYIACRNLSAQEFTLQVGCQKGSYLYEYLSKSMQELGSQPELGVF